MIAEIKTRLNSIAGWLEDVPTEGDVKSALSEIDELLLAINQEEARRKAGAAPDRDKLLAYANELGTLPVPVSKMSTEEGKRAAEEIMHMVLELSSAIEDIANRL